MTTATAKTTNDMTGSTRKNNRAAHDASIYAHFLDVVCLTMTKKNLRLTHNSKSLIIILYMKPISTKRFAAPISHNVTNMD